MATLLRKNAAHLTGGEWTAFCNAVLAMKSAGAYDELVVAHAGAVLYFGLIQAPKKKDFTPEYVETNGAHRGPAFLAWHRAMLMDFESRLQKFIDPKYQGLGVPYWDWSQDPSGQSVFNPKYLGTQGTPLADGMFTKWECVELQPGGAVVPFGPLSRALGAMAPMPDMTRAMPAVMYCGSYDSFSSGTYADSFRRQMERQLHDYIHMWVGGPLATVAIAPNDPVFYLHHCNVDRLWVRWQEMHPSAAYFQDPEVLLPYGQNYTDPMIELNLTPQQVWDYTKLGYTYERDAAVRRVAGVSYSTSAVTKYSQSPATLTLQTGSNTPPALALQVGCSGWYVEYENGDNNQFRQLQIDLPAPAYGGPVPSGFDAVASFHDVKTTRAFSLQVQASKLFLTDPGGYGALLVGRETVYPWLDGTGTVSWSIDLAAPPANAEYALPFLSWVDIGYQDRDHWISGERVWIDQLPVDRVPAKITGTAALWDDSGNKHLTGSLGIEVLYFGTKPSASSGYNYVLSNVLDRRVKFPRSKGSVVVSVDTLSGVPAGTKLIVPVLAGFNWAYTDGDSNLLQHLGLVEAPAGVTTTTSKCYLRDNNQDDYWEGELHELVLCFSPYWV